MKTIKLFFLFLIILSPYLFANLNNGTVDIVQESLNLMNNNIDDDEKNSLKISLIVIIIFIVILSFIWFITRFIFEKDDLSRIDKYSKID